MLSMLKVKTLETGLNQALLFQKKMGIRKVRFMMIDPFNVIPRNDNSFQMKYSHMTLTGKIY